MLETGSGFLRLGRRQKLEMKRQATDGLRVVPCIMLHSSDFFLSFRLRKANEGF
jgi:hypothetical protein